MRRRAWLWAAPIVGAWMLALLVAYNAWSFVRVQEYRACCAESYRPPECSQVFIANLPVYKCTHDVAWMMGCEESDFVTPCYDRAFHVCHAALVYP